MSKGSQQRPGAGYSEGYDMLWPKQKLCGLCRKPAHLCGCVPTEDGPGQGSDEVKTHYERRRFDREGV